MIKFLLKVDVVEYIEMEFPVPPEEMFYMDKIFQKFYVNKTWYNLSHLDALGILRDRWIDILKAILANQRPLKIGTRGLGYEWNQITAQEIRYCDRGNYWWGISYIVGGGFNGEKYTSGWLYNDEQGQIIFEVTENYFWHFEDESEGEHYITYQEFMKNYKPLITRIIPHEVARRWLAQCEHLLEQICENEKKWDEHITLNEQLHKEGKCEECNAKGITYG